MKVVPQNTKILAALVGVAQRSLMAALEEDDVEAAEDYCRSIRERVAQVEAALGKMTAKGVANG